MLVLTLFPFDSTQVSPKFNIPNFDKIVHTGLFGVHAYLMVMYLIHRDSMRDNLLRMIGGAIILSFSFGLLIEIIQIFIPERNFEILDLLADIFGILIGILIFYIKFHFFTD